ncbi:MAG: DUF2490 domain-containing protein [Flavobacteriales bacterium]|nr:DUF2490 domain-containing protein [Flavobacteriales bacterium]
MPASSIRYRLFGSIVCVLLAMACARRVHAQDPVADQRNAWVMYNGNHRLTKHWGVHTEGQWRRHDGVEHWQQSVVRVGADYYTPAGPMISAGYGWIASFPYGEQPIAYRFNEHRIWQQFLLAQSAWRAQFQHRFRLEQRFMEQRIPDGEGGTVADGHQFKQRARYRFMVTVPLSRKELLNNTLFLAVYDEVFIQFGQHVGANVLDQNRLYAALGWRFNTNVNVQLGYLNQYVFKADGIRAERNHTLQVGLVYNLDLRGE